MTRRSALDWAVVLTETGCVAVGVWAAVRWVKRGILAQFGGGG